MHRREFLLGVGAAAIAAGCGSSPTTPTPIIQTPVTPVTDPPAPPPAPVPLLGITHILAFGDSLTSGTVSAPRALAALTSGLRESYPFKLQALSSARYTGQTVTVLNDGYAGKSAAEDRDRFNASLSGAKPDLLLLMHGANDLLALVGTSAAQIDAGVVQTVSAVEDLVRDATARGIRVMLATLPPAIQGLQRGGSAPYLGRYNAQVKTMAAKKGAQIVDVNAQLSPSLVGEDGLHLSEAGYQRVAEIFFDAIVRTYDVTSAIAAR